MKKKTSKARSASPKPASAAAPGTPSAQSLVQEQSQERPLVQEMSEARPTVQEMQNG